MSIPLAIVCAINRRLLRPRPSRGFTTIELVVTLIVVGILAVAVVPRLDALRGYDDIAYRDQVKAALQYARKSAVAQRRDVTVTLAGNNLSLTIAKAPPDETSAGTQNLDLPSKSSACAANNQVCPRSGSSVTLTGTASFTFSPLGQPSGAATYTVTGDATHSVTVEAETGYVH